MTISASRLRIGRSLAGARSMKSTAPVRRAAVRAVSSVIGTKRISSRYGRFFSKYSGFLASTSSLFGTQLTNLNGPVPTMYVFRSPRFATSSFGTIPVTGIVRLLRSDASGLFRLRRMVYLSGTSIFDTLSKKCAYGDPVFLSIMRSKLYFTSSAVISRPLWNLTPRRTTNRYVVSLGASHRSTRSGTGFRFASARKSEL